MVSFRSWQLAKCRLIIANPRRSGQQPTEDRGTNPFASCQYSLIWLSIASLFAQFGYNWLPADAPRVMVRDSLSLCNLLWPSAYVMERAARVP